MFHWNKIHNPILWTRTSESLYRIILSFLSPVDNMIEVGSGTGHISYFLAKKGHSVYLNDIRQECLDQSKQIYAEHGVKCETISGSLFKIKSKFDFLWNSGLVQCLEGKNRQRLIKKLSKISRKVLLFYPDTESQTKVKGNNAKNIPGVDDATEYSIGDIPELMNISFYKVVMGELSAKEINLPYKMYYICGENPK